MQTVDLRSDTITRPTESMYRAMREAELGDDGYHDDPTVNRLEDAAAARLGKEAAMFVPSGTAANLTAILTHGSTRGGEVLAEASAHVLRSEMGGMAMLGGLFHRAMPGTRGQLDLDVLAEAINPAMKPNRIPTALVELETSHNAHSGAVLPLAHIRAVAKLAHDQGVPLHIDGARVFNAEVASGVPAKEIVAQADSVSFCLSKGLSAPVGSLLVGSAAFIERARGYRRMVGAVMRQSGVLAAAGLVALESMIDRLAEDHARAKKLAQRVNAIDPRLTNPDDAETNIVMIDLPAGSTEAWLAALGEAGLRCNSPRKGRLRFVTHRHIDDQAVDLAIERFGKVYRRMVN
jgi:threonine aldolase